jgi:hypothetical protein
MRNELHTRRATIMTISMIAVILLLLLPAWALLSFESARVDAASSERNNDTVGAPFLVARVLSPEAAATPAVARPRVQTDPVTEHATQSAAMLLTGTLLIGVGSVVRKAVAS